MEVTSPPTASTTPATSSSPPSPSSPSTQLGCGRNIDTVWDNIDQAPNPHEMSCPYCRAARSDLSGLREATRDMRERDDADPDLQASPDVLDRILAIARTEVRRGRTLPLDRPRPGQPVELTVSEQAVAAVVRRTGDQTSHLQIRRCAVELDDGNRDKPTASDSDAAGHRSGEAEPASVTLSLQVSSDRSAPIARAVNELRQTVIDTISREIGLFITTVDVSVEDLHDA